MKEKIKLAVIIPTYNRNAFLVQCLDRLHPNVQQLPATEYEVIVSDDNKDDSARKIIEDRYPWVQWIDGPKRGPAANRNNGAKHAQGNWLVFTDDDCQPTPEWLLGYKNAINKSTYKVFEGLTDADRPKRRFNEQSPVNLKGGKFWSCNISVEKSFFLSIGGFDENFPYAAMEDVDLHHRIKKVEKILFVPQAKVIHPWRAAKAFKGYKKWISSHKYILKKDNTNINFSYRFKRIKILIGDLFNSTKELIGFSFRGIGFYFERLWFNILMIFI